MPQQFIESERAVLAELLKMNVSKQEIARRLGKHRSTIDRELARNTGPVGYICQEAQQRTDVRRQLGRRPRKMNDPQVRKYVCRRLKQFWSPDQIAGRLELEQRRPSGPSVSRQTIYAWIRARPAEERDRWRERKGDRSENRSEKGTFYFLYTSSLPFCFPASSRPCLRALRADLVRFGVAKNPLWKSHSHFFRTACVQIDKQVRSPS